MTCGYWVQGKDLCFQYWVNEGLNWYIESDVDKCSIDPIRRVPHWLCYKSCANIVIMYLINLKLFIFSEKDAKEDVSRRIHKQQLILWISVRRRETGCMSQTTKINNHEWKIISLRMCESRKKRRKWMWCYLGGSPCPWYPWDRYSTPCLSIAGSQFVTWKNFPPKFPNFSVACCSTTPVWERVYYPLIQNLN